MHQAYTDSENIDAETCDETVEVKSHDVKVELKSSCFQGPPGPKGDPGLTPEEVDQRIDERLEENKLVFRDIAGNIYENGG